MSLEMGMLEQLFLIFLSQMKWFLFRGATCTLVEIVVPGERQSWLSRVRGLAFWTLYMVVGIFVGLLTTAVLHWLHIKPLFTLDLSGTTNSDNIAVRLLGYTVFPLAAVFVFDFFYYFLHRAQHALPFLWRLHSTHHSIEELNSINCFHHLSEDLVRLPFIWIPTTLLVSLTVPQVTITAFLVGIAAQLFHANSKLSFGIFRYIVTEPRHHRIHHSIERQHWNKNYAFFFPIWDVLFGTVHFPRKGEYPRTGLGYVHEPRTLKDYLVVPKAKPKKAKPAVSADGD